MCIRDRRRVIGKEPEALKALKPTVQINRPEPDDVQKWISAAEQSSYTVQALSLIHISDPTRPY